MFSDEETNQELQKMLADYAQRFPGAGSIYQPALIPDVQMVALLQEANGRELVFHYPPDTLDAVSISFREPSGVMPPRSNCLTLQELLYNRGLPPTSKTKIVRHRDTTGKLDLLRLYQDEPQRFLDYQRQQGNPVFDRCEYVVSLLGEEGSSARFVGVYRVKGIDHKTEEHIYYLLTPMSGFEDLEERVIIDWGKAAISWHQWFERKAPKYVVEIQRQRFQKPFRDYLDFTLTFGALRQLVTSQGPADEWRRMLSVVKGVYLIRDLSTGYQYIGSAYRENGIWGRWAEYARTNGHGGNVELRKLLDTDAAYARHFQFTILMTLSRTTTDQEVIRWEQRFKEKIGAKLCLN